MKTIIFSIGLLFAGSIFAQSTNQNSAGNIFADYSSNCKSVRIITTSQELSAVKLLFADQTSESFGNLTGYYGTFSGTGKYKDKVLLGTWVKVTNSPLSGSGDFISNVDKVCSGVSSFSVSGSTGSKGTNKSGTISATFITNCTSVTVTSTVNPISNVVLKLQDQLEQKFDHLNGTSGTFSPTGLFAGLKIVGIWVKAGNNESGDGPGYGEFIANGDAACANSTAGFYRPGDTMDHKITICHLPGGDTSKRNTITVDYHSWPAHESHGDNLGPCCDTCGNTNPIPVKLVKFEAEKIMPNVVELKWATASEINNDYIAIEKSTDINNWEEVCRVKGAGNSQTYHEYNCIDNNANSGGQNLAYYRPKQVDFNGTYEYFNIIKLRLQDAAYGTTIDNAYPNPTSDRIHIRYNSADNELFKIRVTSMEGKVLLQNQFTATPGTQVVDVDLPETLLNKGFYILEVQSDETVYRQKIYKQ